jgi:CPA2 family monovalent cation:H+ antiporter-2
MTGILAGPYGLNLISESAHNVEMLAEIGVILLLFIIGLEFSLKSLAAIQKAVFIGGSLQVGGTILAAALIYAGIGSSWPEAVFIGFLFSLSSTAIVLKLLQEKGEISSPHGKISLAILIFQDIIVVPMMLFTPLIAGKAENVTLTLLILLLKGVFIIVFVLFNARVVVPRLLYLVARTKSKELFILAVVVICFAVAWLTSSMGLSLALGAFLAGLIISESEYSHQATSNVLPFREIFTSFFFVSIGMLLDVSFLFHHLPSIFFYTLLTILLKALIAASAAASLRFPGRTSILVGLSLFQVGEFAFILSKTGIENNLLSQTTYQYFLASLYSHHGGYTLYHQCLRSDQPPANPYPPALPAAKKNGEQS